MLKRLWEAFETRLTIIEMSRIPTDVDARVEALIPENVWLQLCKLTAEGESASGKGAICSIKDQIIALCKQNNLGRYRRLPPKKVGVHPMNRDGQGIDPQHCHKLMEKIKALGWSWSAVQENAISAQENPYTHYIEAHTMSLTKNSDLLGNYDLGQIESGTLGCGHLNQGLGCFVDGVCTDETNISIDGRMSKSAIGDDTNYLEAINDGIEFFEIRWEVLESVPLVAKVIQSALNASAQVQCREDWSQLLGKVHAALSQGVASSEVIKMVRKSQSPCAGDAPSHVDFCKKWLGSSTSFIQDLSAFKKIFSPTGRHVSASLFNWLSDLKFASDEIIPFFIIGVVKYECSGPKCRDGVCANVTKGDVMSIMKNKKALAQTANRFMRECRSFLGELGISKKDLTLLIGRLDTRLVRYVFGHVSDGSITSCEQCARFIAHEASDLCDSVVESPWGHEEFGACVAKALPASSPAVPTSIEFTNDGVAECAGKLTVLTNGFQVGNNVRLKKCSVSDDVIALSNIVDISDNGSVSLIGYRGNGVLDESTKLIVCVDEFLNNYAKSTVVVELMPGWPSNCAYGSLESAAKDMMSRVSTCLYQVLRTYPPLPLRIRSKPTRSVYTLSELSPRQLVLVPASTRLVTDDAPGAVKCSVDTGAEHDELFILNSTTKDYVAPFWSVRVTHEKEEANLEMEDIIVNLPPATVTMFGRTTWNEQNNTLMTFQCAVNTSKLEPECELVVYRPKPIAKAAIVKRKVVELPSARKLAKGR